MIDHLERIGSIIPPFSEAERALAGNLAAAWHFCEVQEELPGRALENSPEWFSFSVGVARVKQLRKDGKGFFYPTIQELGGNPPAGTR